MMKIPFSQRYGFIEKQPIIYDDLRQSLRNRFWNLFIELEYKSDNDSKLNILMDHLGIIIPNRERGFIFKKHNIEVLRKRIKEKTWFEFFDCFEYYISLYDENKNELERICKRLNVILEEENSGYRFINGLLTPITNEEEIKTIEKASHSKYEPVNCHINKAIALLSDKKNPDYNNTIKEAISAVESLCCIITQTPKATLGDALNKLESKGIQLHNSLKKAMHSLYGYTSDAGGIRHGSIDFTDADSSDARYMLITCSSFINYVIEKAEKI